MDEVPTITAVKVQSEHVKVLNVCSSGLLTRCRLRLPPGVFSQLEIVRLDGSLRVRGRVIRCEVAEISRRGIQYNVAIAFDRCLDFIDQDPSGDVTAVAALGDPSSVPLVFEGGRTWEFEQHLALNGW